MNVQIDESWKRVLQAEFSKPYFQQIVLHLRTEKQVGQTIYPPGSKIFNAFSLSTFENTRVVLLGQDPYHGAGQAMGLSFSVQKGMTLPPSLQNIYKELHQDLGLPPANHGDLTAWAQQGVLLLNASLTVRANEPNSHAKIGWQEFTNAAIIALSQVKSHVVFMLWGRFAQEKQSFINNLNHLVLKAAHPSPFSAHHGFFGCRHFSKTNEYLVKQGLDPIDWRIPN